ncbi:MAG: dihydroneopterin aldolase [Bacteroidota bacterium]
MGRISLENMEFYAYHGCFEEEQTIGNRFVVNVVADTDTHQAEATDNLLNTVNYQEIYWLVKAEMDIKSKLLEHVARRIANSIKQGFPQITWLSVKVSKINPPLGGKIDSVSVLIEI